MFCGNCGQQIKDGSAFCGFCGAKQITGAPSYQGQPNQQFRQPSPNQMNYYRQAQPVSISGNDFKAIVDTIINPFKDHSFGILPACVILVLTFIVNIFRYCTSSTYKYYHPFVIAIVVTLILLFGLFITVFIDHLDSMDVVKGLGKVAQILQMPVLIWFISSLIGLIGGYGTFAYVLTSTLDMFAWFMLAAVTVKISRQKLPDYVFVVCIVVINFILRIYMTYGVHYY